MLEARSRLSDGIEKPAFRLRFQADRKAWNLSIIPVMQSAGHDGNRYIGKMMTAPRDMSAMRVRYIGIVNFQNSESL